MTGSPIPGTSVFVDGLEMPGYIADGLWPGTLDQVVRLDDKLFRLTGAEVRPFRLIGEDWTILGCDIAFRDAKAYQQGLTRAEFVVDCVLECGARVAWIGSEGLPFADPPYLFTADWMEGGVLAAKARGGPFLSGLGTAAGHRTLGVDEMRRLETAVRATYGENAD